METDWQSPIKISAKALQYWLAEHAQCNLIYFFFLNGSLILLMDGFSRQAEVHVDTDLFGKRAQYKIWCADGKVAGQY